MVRSSLHNGETACIVDLELEMKHPVKIFFLCSKKKNGHRHESPPTQFFSYKALVETVYPPEFTFGNFSIRRYLLSILKLKLS